MRVWITKPDPRDFVSGGMDKMRVWSSRPHFYAGGHIGAWGEHEINWPEWGGDSLMTGRQLRKLCSAELHDDIWAAYKHTYLGDQQQDLYEPVYQYYNAAQSWAYAHHRLFLDYSSITGNMTPKQRSEKENFIIAVNVGKYAASMVEKKGMCWREWILEYDLELGLKEPV